MSEGDLKESITKIEFDNLGPIIINTDGTMARIPNWNTLTDIEQKKAVRLIALRNQRRKETLLSNHVEINPQDTKEEPKEILPIEN